MFHLGPMVKFECSGAGLYLFNADPAYGDSLDDAEGEEYQESEEDEDYENDRRIDEEQTLAMARELAETSNFGVFRTRAAREHAAQQHFGEAVAYKAGNAFEYEVLPKQVSEMQAAGSSAKEIAKKLGVTLAKVEQGFLR
ncbi:MAG: hypothetical protein JWQ90_1526 [Hydrocarboniphaga sp.]|uniref:hypothetical protein n=1 Tax=Hydrocarboniphaga sp. TaxID=2033016 RepID=UPI00262A4702|nr:hypothetical protein [Hydrocarboniphaga sp.]MDB5969076.1 hypothetical protein [Hydrocarboniphaga sp.]